MGYDNKKIAGFLLFVGAAQFVLAVIIAEALDTEYKFAQPMNVLGSGSAGVIFNSSLVILGLFIIIGAYLIQRPLNKQTFNNKLFWLLMTITGIGAAGVGIFNESTGNFHVTAVRILWIFAIPTVIMSYKFQKKPFSYISVILGVIILTAVVLFLSGANISPSFYLGIGKGGMQRMIQYPILLWILGFGAHLIANSSESATAQT